MTSRFSSSDAFGNTAHSLEQVAIQHGLIAAQLPRAICTTKAEEIFRRLAQYQSSDEPWFPFGHLGPLLICAHYDPATSVPS